MDFYSYFRSSAAFRVRIAMALKGLEPTQRHFIHLRHGEQATPPFSDLNPNHTVPALVLSDGTALTQSLAIIEWLEETAPTPPLLPQDPTDRALVRSAAYVIACDIHPINNLRVVEHLKSDYGADQAGVARWMRHWMGRGLAAFQALLPAHEGPFCFPGDSPGFADVILIPQLFNGRRFDLDMAPLARLAEIEQACLALPAFAEQVPSRQPDAEA